MTHSEVLIVGAGPTGLVLALWLTKQGVGVRIIDRAAEPGTTSRALAVQVRTLELYRQLDLADAVVQRGHKVPAVNLWTRGEHAARLRFGILGENLTPYPFIEIFPQDEHERLLIERLQQAGVSVERHTELVGFSDDGEHISARLRRADGAAETCEARYLAGCDGARSLVRERLALGFPGGTYRQVFYVADIEGSGPAVNGELNVDLDEADFLAVFPLAGAGAAGPVHGGDRLPWVQQGTSDNHASLQATLWQVHVYGSAGEELRAACARRALPLHVFRFTPAHGRCGLRRDALYLLRPDTYVALATDSAGPAALERYFEDRRLLLHSAGP